MAEREQFKLLIKKKAPPEVGVRIGGINNAAGAVWAVRWGSTHHQTGVQLNRFCQSHEVYWVHFFLRGFRAFKNNKTAKTAKTLKLSMLKKLYTLSAETQTPNALKPKP